MGTYVQCDHSLKSVKPWETMGLILIRVTKLERNLPFFQVQDGFSFLHDETVLVFFIIYLLIFTKSAFKLLQSISPCCKGNSQEWIFF